MDFIKKIRKITSILYSLSCINRRRCKKPYDLKTIATGIYIHLKTKIPYTQISLAGTAYDRKYHATNYIYWLNKLKYSGMMNEIMKFI